MIKKICLSFFILICLIADIQAKLSELDSLLNELDKTILSAQNYKSRKEAQILKLKQQSHTPNLTVDEIYSFYSLITNEYESFRCDSARVYAMKRLDFAKQQSNENWIIESKIQLASVLARAAMFNNAIDVLDNIDGSILSESQKTAYYKAYYETYVYWTEYFTDGYEQEELNQKRLYYHELFIKHSPTSSYEYATYYGVKYIEAGDFDKAEKLLLSYLPYSNPDTRAYAILTSIMAFLYERNGNTQKQKEYLALSALSDIRSSTMENVSLRTLAVILFEEGDIGRANTYIKKSMDDANFYNARLRNIQTSKVLSIIDEAYQTERINQQNQLKHLLTIISILSVILLATIFLIVGQMKRLTNAQKKNLQINSQLDDVNKNLQEVNHRQQLTNQSLKEANQVKEQFISSFLEICTKYIGKFETFKNTVHLKTKANQINDVLRLTSSTADSAQDLKELYDIFDKAFLNIYPDFVQQLNSLLKPDAHYPIHTDNSLNHEMRIFALIRLGITDSNQMATFLHYSLRTIYNYRSKVKSKAIHPNEDFEEKVKQLCM